MSEQGVLREPAWSRPASRVDRLRELDQGSAELVDRLLRVARTGLPGMQLPTARCASPGGSRPPGWSRNRRAAPSGTPRSPCSARGTSTRPASASCSAAVRVGEVCDVLVDRLSSTNSVGDAALAVWATAACGHDGLERALGRLDALDAGPARGTSSSWPGWSPRWSPPGGRRRRATSWTGPAPGCWTRSRRALFGHVTGPDLVSRYRRHVGCFADQVYPIQALARLHASGDDPARSRPPNRCADRICRCRARPASGGGTTTPAPAGSSRATRSTACTSTRWRRWRCSTSPRPAARSSWTRSGAGWAGWSRRPR